jgi:hypothetical protein
MSEPLAVMPHQTIPPDVARSMLRAFEHRHELVHLIYTAADHAEAVRRIADLLGHDDAMATAIMDLPLRRMLPEDRAGLEAECGRESDPGSVVVVDGSSEGGAPDKGGP